MSAESACDPATRPGRRERPVDRGGGAQARDEVRELAALPERVARPRIHEHRAADGAVALAQPGRERLGGRSSSVSGCSGPLPRKRSSALRWSSLSDARIFGVRSSRIWSTTAIFASWPGGTTSSSVRTLATIASSGGVFDAVRDGAADGARLVGVVGEDHRRRHVRLEERVHLAAPVALAGLPRVGAPELREVGLDLARARRRGPARAPRRRARWPSRPRPTRCRCTRLTAVRIGVRRFSGISPVSSHAMSGGIRTNASSQESTMPMPPMNPNWRKPRKSVSASDAYETPAASAAERVPMRAPQTAELERLADARAGAALVDVAREQHDAEVDAVADDDRAEERRVRVELGHAERRQRRQGERVDRREEERRQQHDDAPRPPVVEDDDGDDERRRPRRSTATGR